MILSSPGDVIFHIGSFKIYYYGVIMALAVVSGLLACKIVCRKFYSKSDFEAVYDLSIGTIIFGFLGARIYYFIAASMNSPQNFWEIFAVRNGGMSIHGAIIGGLIFVLLYLKFKKLPVLKYLDILTFGLITGQIIGRWGNFFNSEAFGLPTFSWLKLYIPPMNRPSEFAVFDYFHPTFLYEIILNILILIILIFIAKRTQKCGYVFFSYILMYSLVRFFIENIRLDSVLNINSIPLAQIVSILGLITGTLGLLILNSREVKKC